MDCVYIQPVFNARYLSWMEAQKTENRDMYCPVCGFKVAVIPKNQTTIQNVFCRKCKFTGLLSPAYFWKAKDVRNGSGFPKIRAFIR